MARTWHVVKLVGWRRDPLHSYSRYRGATVFYCSTITELCSHNVKYCLYNILYIYCREFGSLIESLEGGSQETSVVYIYIYIYIHGLWVSSCLIDDIHSYVQWHDVAAHGKHGSCIATMFSYGRNIIFTIFLWRLFLLFHFKNVSF